MSVADWLVLAFALASLIFVGWLGSSMSLRAELVRGARQEDERIWMLVRLTSRWWPRDRVVAYRGRPWKRVLKTRELMVINPKVRLELERLYGDFLWDEAMRIFDEATPNKPLRLC